MELIDIPLKYFVAGFAAWVVAFLCLAKRPEWIGASVLVFVFFMPLILQSLLGGRYIPMGQIIVLFFSPPLLVSMMFRRPHIVWNDVLLIAAYGLCILISIVLNDLSLWGRKATLVPLVFMGLIYLSIDSKTALYRLLYVYIVLIVINAIVAGLQQAGFEWAYPSAYDTRMIAGGYRRGYGLAGNFTVASLYASITIPIAAAMFIRSRTLAATLLSFVVGLVGVAGQIFSVSRSAVLGIALGLWVVLRRGIDLRALVAGSVALAVAALIVVASPLTRESGRDLLTHLSVFVSEGPLDSSAANRPELAQMGLDTWAENRIFGGGPFATQRTQGRDPHNTLVNVLSQYGVVGLLCFLLILYRCYRRTLHASRMGYRTEGAALGGALVATLPIAFFHSLDYLDLFWFVPALCLALGRFPHPEEATQREEVMRTAPTYALQR